MLVSVDTQARPEAAPASAEAVAHAPAEAAPPESPLAPAHAPGGAEDGRGEPAPASADALAAASAGPTLRDVGTYVDAPASAPRDAAAERDEDDATESADEQAKIIARCRQHVQLVFERKGKVDEAVTESLCELFRRQYVRACVAHELNMMRSKYPLNRDERSFSVLCALIDAATRWCQEAADYEGACAFLNLASTFYRRSADAGAPPEFVTARMRCGADLAANPAFWERTFSASLEQALDKCRASTAAISSQLAAQQQEQLLHEAESGAVAVGLAPASAPAAPQPQRVQLGAAPGDARARDGGGAAGGAPLQFAHGVGSAAADARRWRELADEQRAEALTAEQSVVFGQLGFFVYTMLSLGVAAERGRTFVRAMCVMHNLSAEYSSLLLDVMDQYPTAGAALEPPPPPPPPPTAAGARVDGGAGAGGGAGAAATHSASATGSITRWTTALLTAPLEADEAERVERLLSGASKRMSELAVKTRRLVESASAAPSRAIDKLSSASVSHASRSMSAKLYKVGLERYKAGCYAEAEELFRSALRINEREMRPNSEELAVNMNNLAAALERQEKFAEAHALCKRSHEILTLVLGASNPRTQHVASKLHEIEAAMKSQPRARAFSQASSSASQAGVEADPVHLLPPGAFLSDHSFQQPGVESYLASAVDGLFDRCGPQFGEMWVPGSPAYVSSS